MLPTIMMITMLSIFLSFILLFVFFIMFVIMTMIMLMNSHPHVDMCVVVIIILKQNKRNT